MPDESELDELYQEATRLRRMAEATKAAVEFMEQRAIWVQRWVRIMQFRKRYAGEEIENDNGVFIAEGS